MDRLENVPAHVSIIMDGNGRWAKERGKQRVFGHMNGVDSVRACVEASGEAGVKYLSLYAFSEENWGRPEEEVSFLMDMMLKSMKEEMPALNREGVRFLVRGNRTRLSREINEMIDECESLTASNDRLTLVIMLSYSGKWDILQAAKALCRDVSSNGADVDEVTEETFRKYLVTNDIPDPDIIIRTSGEKRLSNYFLWQGAYSEFIFTDTLWPDFRKAEFFAALEEYSKRDRRYGKVK